MAVNVTHPEYNYYSSIWTMIDDFVLGEKQVKSKGATYLPLPLEWSMDQYVQHIEYAPFTNFTVRTINALLGAMFIRNPLIDLPEQIQYLLDNADGKGNSILQVVRRMSLEAIKKGRSGVYVDFPRVNADGGYRKLSIKETETLKASITLYDAQHIINWKEDDNGLTLVVLKEQVETQYEDFEPRIETQYRVLRKSNGVYSVTLYFNNEIIDQYTPTDFTGNTFDFIPFFFNGSVNNDATCDNSPVYEIVSKNKTHYQLEAEIMRSIRLLGSPMLVVSVGDISAQQFLEINGLSDGSPLRFGASRGLILGQQGSASLLQAQANDMAQQKAKDVLQEAIMLGARLVTKGGSSRVTAEQIRIETSAENSVISAISKNVEHTVQKALECIQRFMGVTVDPTQFKMSTEFYAQTADAQVLMFAHSMLNSGMLAPSDMLDLLKNSGIVDTNRTLEQVREEAKTYLEELDARNLALQQASSEPKADEPINNTDNRIAKTV